MSEFRFKQFTVRQDRCAMKVGMDGVTLGAWAAADRDASTVRRILDIGCGTGLISLMAAQRFPMAEVVGIDIDKDAAQQAEENVNTSHYKHRIKILCSSLQEFIEGDKPQIFDAIICNPPYFDNSLECPDSKRTLARHNATLPFPTLMKASRRMLAPSGTLSIVIPTEGRHTIEDEAIFAGLTQTKRTAIVTREGKSPKRWLLEFTLPNGEETYVTQGMTDNHLSLESAEYALLTADFYLDRGKKS